MRPIDRVYAERQLISAIDKEMNFDDVHLFFKRMRIPRPDFGDDEYSSKELIRGYLGECSDEVLLEIARQLALDLPVNEDDDGLVGLPESKYWLIDHFKVFISHVHTARAEAGALRKALQKYAISAFVAHDDIDTSDEWCEEILRSLMSMDGFVAIITSDFNSSKWTDQEVGIAVARNVLLIPINKGQNPYGFISKYQALPSKGLTVRGVAAEVFRTISANPRTRGKMIDSLVRTISAGSESTEVLFRIERLNSIEGVGIEDWERVRENVAGNAAIRSSQDVLNSLNAILEDKGIVPVALEGDRSRSEIDDEIPF